jgi:2-C-methyl-D-erythritol 2,4-cyclodiphosphate synthase
MTRIGFGYDVHRMVEGRPLVLGGVEIPSDLGLEGHSDADVLIHAIVDALLGAAALGDIGAHFPDTDAEWQDADSRIFLESARKLIRQAGFEICNIDSTVVVEKPRLRPHILAIRSNIADVLGLDISAVSVKATTNERLGFIGEREGAAAYAVCAIRTAGSRD